MSTRFLFGLLLITSPAFSQELALTIGVSDWRPRLEALRTALYNSGDDLVMNSANNRYLNLSVQTDRGWRTLYYTRWQGESRTNRFAIEIQNYGATWGFSGPFGLTAGIGPNLFRLTRQGSLASGSPEDASKDWLWGAHMTGGMMWTIANPLAFEVRRTWHWAKQSTLGGREYDLGGSMWSAGVSLAF